MMRIDAVGTTIEVQMKSIDTRMVRTTINIYGDAASVDMCEAYGKSLQMNEQQVDGRWEFVTD
jgi:hypothetical protein